MHMLISTTSCGTLLGQSLSKTAFAITLLKLTKGVRWQQCVLWFCIVTMDSYNLVKVRWLQPLIYQDDCMLTAILLQIIFEWGKVCGDSSYQVSYRLDFCVGKHALDDLKEGGNGSPQVYQHCSL